MMHEPIEVGPSDMPPTTDAVVAQIAAIRAAYGLSSETSIALEFIVHPKVRVNHEALAAIQVSENVVLVMTPYDPMPLAEGEGED